MQRSVTGRPTRVRRPECPACPGSSSPRYNEAENVEADRARRARAARPRGPERLSDPRRRRPLARRHGRDRRPAGRASTPLSTCCTARCAKGSAPPTSPASATRCEARRRGFVHRDGLRLLPRPGRSRAAAGRAARGGRPRARLALRHRRRRDQLGTRAQVRQSRRLVVRAASCSASLCAISPAASSAFAGEVLEAIDLPTGALTRVCLPGRAHPSRDRRGLSRGRAADRLSRPPARPVEDVLADRGRGRVARGRSCAAAPARSAGRPAALERRRRAEAKGGEASRAAAGRVDHRPSPATYTSRPSSPARWAASTRERQSSLRRCCARACRSCGC